MKLAQWVHVAAGVWLMAAPTMAGYADASAADLHRTVGPLLTTFGVVALWAATRDVRWVDAPLALVLVGAPMFGGHPGSAIAVGMLTGVVVLAVTPAGGPDRQARGRGWRGVIEARREPGG